MSKIMSGKICFLKIERSEKEQKLQFENKHNGQATKGAGRMPWHQEPTKDVISCEKPRGAANKH